MAENRPEPTIEVDKNETLVDHSRPQIDDENVMESQRTAPDGGSPAPSPPPRQSAKKWVRFDESTPATIIDEENKEKSNETDTNPQGSEIAQLPKPPIAAPRRSNLQKYQNGHAAESAMKSDVSSAAINGESAGDIAQISVNVEEAKKPGKSSILRPPALNGDVAPARQSATATETRQYENGKVITEKRPENKHCQWVTIARFDPYKMPKSLISDQLTMPVEDYVTAMEMLTNDFRFRCYTVLYRRLIAGWLVASLFILIIILISGLRGLPLFIITLFWLLLTCVGVFVCLFIKKKINKGLHNCVASVNKLLLRYNLLVGMEDRGKMSCHKIVIPFVYMESKDCLERIKQMLAQQRQSDNVAVSRNVPSVAVDIDPPTASAYGRPATLEEKAEELVLKYSQSYVRAMVRRIIRFPSRPSEGVRDDVPLHCAHSYCLCQYLRKYHFDRPPRKWYHKFWLDSEIPSHESTGFSTSVVAYGYPPVLVG